MGVLDKISIKGFKSIRSAELEIRPINVLIGANGSGKSNLLEAMAFLQAIRSGNLQGYVGRAGGADRLLHFGAKTTDRIVFHTAFDGESNQYEITLMPTDVNTLYPTSEVLFFWNKVRYPDRPYDISIPSRGGEASISNPNVNVHNMIYYVRRYLDSWRTYHFHDTGPSSPMKKTADLNDNRYLSPDGSNLAAFLYLLRERNEIEYGLIRRTVQLAAPFFDDFALEPQRLNADKIRLEWKHIGDDDHFDVSSLSDGTLRFIAIVTLLLQPAEDLPSVILLDEPELGMHPVAITLLASVIRSVSVDTQIILATQSPILLDHFDPEDVVVANRVKGATEFSRPDAKQLEVWLERYSLGELWEKNDLGVGGGPTGSWQEAVQ